MRPVKVCCFCERWESGGIESFLCNVFLHMDLASVQIEIVAPEILGSIFTEPLQREGVRFIQLSGKQQKLWTNYRMFCMLLRRKQYDVVHLNIFHGLSLYYAYLAKRAGVPVRIAHSHNAALRKSRTRIIKQLVHDMMKELFINNATDLWACSKSAAEFLFSRKVLKNKGFQFVPNGIDTERFHFNAAVRKRVRRELGLEEKFVIGNIGRLCYQKNQDFLLDVFDGVFRQRPESRLLLVGEGEAEAMLRQKAEHLGLSDAVIFYGTSSHAEHLLWVMDIFAFPSRFEGLGIAAVEAQASGLPVLCAENLPGELKLTDSIQFLPVIPEVWVKEILQINGDVQRRDRMEQTISRYDIKKRYR